jgi:hypothetical protein|tara:strand:- start:1459 stop:3045 length:1587 start_codon:yes stop_codon:yes gene_type:complete
MSSVLSRKEIVKEIIKCGKDSQYFINNYAKIAHPMHGLIPFKTYPFQDDLLGDFDDYRFNVILKGRQLGISTITAAYICWMLLFYRDKNVLVIATKFQTAANLVKKVKSMMLGLPPWLRIASIKIDNRTSFVLTNGSEVKASSTSADAGRSEALSLLVIDEAAHVEGLEDLWTGLYPTLSTGGRCIALSTPNGVGNWFHKTYVEADAGINDFHPIILPWDVHPERDEAWFVKETRNMSARQIAQELECNFNASGETVISASDINRLYDGITEPEYRVGFDRNLWLWGQYDASCSYLLAADVARGDGADHSVFHVIKLETMEVIGEYQGKPNLEQFASILDSTGREYGNCMLVVENNSLGISILEKLQDREYPNLYFSVKSTHEYITEEQAQGINNSVPGFTTSSKTRPLIIAKMEEFIRNQLITIYSSRLIGEFKTFIWNNNKAQAMRSYNDDLVMALAIACWVRDTALTVNLKDMEYNKAMMSSMIISNKKMDTTISGMTGHNRSSLQNEKAKAKKNYEEFIWLLKG